MSLTFEDTRTFLDELYSSSINFTSHFRELKKTLGTIRRSERVDGGLLAYAQQLATERHHTNRWVIDALGDALWSQEPPTKRGSEDCLVSIGATVHALDENDLVVSMKESPHDNAVEILIVSKLLRTVDVDDELRMAFTYFFESILCSTPSKESTKRLLDILRPRFTTVIMKE